MTVRVHALKTSKYDHLKASSLLLFLRRALSLTGNVLKHGIYLALMSLNFLLNQKLHALNGGCH